MDILNKAQVQELFEKEAVLMGDNDAVPFRRAIELFGEQAVQKAWLPSAGGKFWNVWCLGQEFECRYLTLSGFRYAASCRNAELLSKSEKEVAA